MFVPTSICFSGKLTFRTSQHQHIAYARSISDKAVVLKLVSNTCRVEIELLEHLHRTSTHDNHTIPFNVLHTPHCAIIATPHLNTLSECSIFSVHTTVVLARHLLEAVRFVHTNGVVHRDLKPKNVVVNDDESELFVIDYDLAERVDGRDHVVYGYVGTDGFMAPEVRENKRRERSYSAISADLWAAGNLLQYLLVRCDGPESSALQALWSVSSLLMDSDPARRPRADDALAMLGTPTMPPSPLAFKGTHAQLARPVSLTAH